MTGIDIGQRTVVRIDDADENGGEGGHLVMKGRNVIVGQYNRAQSFLGDFLRLIGQQ